MHVEGLDRSGDCSADLLYSLARRALHGGRERDQGFPLHVSPAKSDPDMKGSGESHSNGKDEGRGVHTQVQEAGRPSPEGNFPPEGTSGVQAYDHEIKYLGSRR